MIISPEFISDIASRHDIGVTEKLNTKAMTSKAKQGRKRKKQKAGLNKSILSVGFGALNNMLTEKKAEERRGRGFQIGRDKGSVMVMYNVATNQQPGLGTSLADVDVFSSTSKNSKRKHTGSMRQLGQMKLSLT